MLKADNLPPSCAVVTKSGKVNFLEPSGPLRACNVTALPLPFITYSERVSVVLVSQHAKRMRRIILLSVACPALPHLSIFSHKRHDFREKKSY